MYRLVLDSALDNLYVALLNDDKILYESYEELGKIHAETMLPKVEEAIKQENISLKDVKEVYSGVGPGSYTGERIAVVLSKMLACMNNISLYSFSSLAGVASSIEEGIIYVLIDCRRGNAYTSKYQVTKDDIKCLKEDSVEVIEDYFKNINDNEIITKGKINPIKLIHSSVIKKIDDINNFSPNYIMEVEAVRIKKGLK